MVERNVDEREVERFDALAARWWDPEGEFRPLHDLNPVRTDYVAGFAELDGLEAADVGCGGGLLSEALAARGARVTAIDLSPKALEVARLHLYESGLEVDYRELSAEELAAEAPGRYQVVTCMELLEHVPDPDSTIGACARLLAPGGRLIASTINRTARAFALAIVGAEYLLGLLPRGTHEYAKFIRPSELVRACRAHGLELMDLSGLRYDPFSRRAGLSDSVAVNYLAAFEKRDGQS